jgi:hypothetical protein
MNIELSKDKVLRLKKLLRGEIERLLTEINLMEDYINDMPNVAETLDIIKADKIQMGQLLWIEYDFDMALKNTPSV